MGSEMCIRDSSSLAHCMGDPQVSQRGLVRSVVTVHPNVLGLGEQRLEELGLLLREVAAADQTRAKRL